MPAFTPSPFLPSPRIFSRDDARLLDHRCVSEYNIPTLLLMESAARNIALIARRVAGGRDILVIAGGGNNGGDGLAAARFLANAGSRVAVLLHAEPASLTPDASVHYSILNAMRIPLIVDPCHLSGIAWCMKQLDGSSWAGVVVLDALFGTGLNRPAHGCTADLIESVNAIRADGSLTIAIDLPSGLDGDFGLPCQDSQGPGACIRANHTITLAAIKRGFLNPASHEFTGELHIADIGAPADAYRQIGEPALMRHENQPP